MNKTYKIFIFVSISFTAEYLFTMQHSPRMACDNYYSHFPYFDMGEDQRRADKAMVEAHKLLKDVKPTPANVIEFMAINNLYLAAKECRYINPSQEVNPSTTSPSAAPYRIKQLEEAYFFAQRYQKAASDPKISKVIDSVIIYADFSKKWAQKCSDYYVRSHSH